MTPTPKGTMTIDSIMHPATAAPSKQQIKSALAVLTAVAETIREVAEVPSGHLYAQLMGKVTAQGYASMIDRLKGAGLVREDGNHILTWTGPKFDKEPA
jgi:hypothetical protein